MSLARIMPGTLRLGTLFPRALRPGTLYIAAAMLVAALFVGAAPNAGWAAEASQIDRKAVQSVIDGQIGAFKAHDHEKAYSFAGPGIRKIFPTVERFIGMVTGGYQPVYDPEHYSFGRSLDVDGTVHQEVILTDKNGKSWQAVYTLQKQEDGSWKITGVKLNPYKGVSA